MGRRRWIIGALALSAFVAWVAVAPTGRVVTGRVTDGVSAATALLVAVPLCVRAMRANHGRRRAAWRDLALMAALYGAGDALWWAWELVVGVAPGAPSIADVLYLSAMPVGAGAVLR